MEGVNANLLVKASCLACYVYSLNSVYSGLLGTSEKPEILVLGQQLKLLMPKYYHASQETVIFRRGQKSQPPLISNVRFYLI